MSEVLETTESLQAELTELQAKLAQKQIEADGDQVEKIELPLATIDILIGGKNTVTLHNVTPPEALLLVALHHHQAKKMPIERILILDQKLNIDPRLERQKLAMKYGEKKVTALFPGAIPNFPKSFRSAMNAGIETKIPEERMFDFDVAK